MPSKWKHSLNLLFGHRVKDQRLASLVEDISHYVAGFGEELVEAMKRDGLYVDGREHVLRREAVAFYCVFVMSYTHDHSERLSHAERLIAEIKTRFDPFWDVSRERVTIPTGQDSSGFPSHLTAEQQSNTLAITIDDRLEFYDRSTREGENLKVIMRLAFAWAYVLQRSSIGDLNIDQVIQTLKENPGNKLVYRGRKMRIEYPDERRDEFIVQWISQSLEPIQQQFDDYFYIARHRRLP